MKNNDVSVGIPNQDNHDNSDNVVNQEEYIRKMTKSEVDSLIDNKRSELDIKLFDMVTKNQVEEKKLEDSYTAETNEEEKAKLLRMLEDEIKKNENNIAMLKE